MSSSVNLTSFETFLAESFGQTPSQRHTLFLNKFIFPQTEAFVVELCALYDCNILCMQSENYLNIRAEVRWRSKIVVETNLSFQRLFQ